MAERREHDPEQTRMSLGEHIEELRKRLIRGLLAIFIAFFVGWFFKDATTEVVMRPMRQSLEWLDRDQVAKYEAKLAADPELRRSEFFLSDDPADEQLRPDLTVSTRPQALGYAEPFWFALKVTLIFAFTVGAPVLLWQMWMFVAAGLYPHERKVVFSYFPVSVALFAGGVAFGFFVLVPYGFYFLASTFPPEKVAFSPRLTDYFSLLSILTLALGAIFQLPLLMQVLVRLDLVQRKTLASYRTHFLVGAFIIGAMLTPPDPVTQALLAGPMILLYEIGLLFARFVEPKPAPAPEAGAED
jgi:sec-independent protein translocase protein TatC